MVTFIFREPAFTQAQVNVLFLLLFSIGLWLTEAIPAFAVGILIIAFLAFSTGYKLFTGSQGDVMWHLH